LRPGKGVTRARAARERCGLGRGHGGGAPSSLERRVLGLRDKGGRRPQLTISFLSRLILNKWFILAMASAFAAALLSYVVLREMGVLAGRFFLSLGAVATILACTFVLGEELTLREWAGIALIMAGVFFVGRW
jgi:drug/metabolite transporter (DMT)-like permease